MTPGDRDRVRVVRGEIGVEYSKPGGVWSELGHPAMKPGDRVRVTRGEFEGRVGTIINPRAQVDAVRVLLKPSASRDEVERRFTVPPGHHGVLLDSGRMRPDPQPTRYIIIPESMLGPAPATDLQWIPVIREDAK